MARVYSRCGLNPTAEEAAAASAATSCRDVSVGGAATVDSSSSAEDGGGGADGGGGVTLFDALARQTVARIEGADLQDVLRWAGGQAQGTGALD